MRKCLLALCLSSTSIVACGGGSGEGESGFEAPRGSDDTTPAGEDAVDSDSAAGADVTIEGLVSLIPDEPGAGDLVIVNEYGPATEAAGVERPEPGADEVSINNWFTAIGRGREGEPGLGLQANGFFAETAFDDAGWRTELGWAPIDLTGAVESLAGDDFGGLYAFRGDFDPETIDEVVRAEPIWGDRLEIEEHSGVEYYSWGEDNDSTTDITVVRQLGQGGRMAVLDEHTILWAWSTGPLESGIDAALGEADSLADNAEIGPLARAMDAEGALAAMFTDDGDAYRQGGDQASLGPYTALGTGTRPGDDGAKLLLAFLFDDTGGAEENTSRLVTVVDENASFDGQAWSDIVTLEDVQADNELLLATLAIADPLDVDLWSTIVFRRETLLASS